MKYLIMMTHSPDDQVSTGQEWTPDEVRASGEHMMRLHRELSEAGELLAAERLAGPDATKVVVSDGARAPVVTDGPYAEAKEFLAGFWMVDVDSEERAIDIAARTSAAPGPGGRATAKRITVWPIMDAHAPEW